MFRYIATDSDSNTKQDDVIISETDTVYYLFGNRNGSVNLIPEQKQTDYFLKIQTEAEFIDLPELVQKIKELPSVLAAFSINPEQLKSKENLIF
jgi:arabinogalactan endo-1,4-beta-galactosidase